MGNPGAIPPSPLTRARRRDVLQVLPVSQVGTVLEVRRLAYDPLSTMMTVSP